MQRIKNIALGIMTEVIFALSIMLVAFLVGTVFYLIVHPQEFFLQ